jgi:hypothetical protein
VPVPPDEFWGPFFAGGRLADEVVEPPAPPEPRSVAVRS